MVTPQIVEYIRNTISQGYPEAKVRDALMKKGWGENDINEAFRIAKSPPAISRPAVPAQPASAQGFGEAKPTAASQPVAIPQTTPQQVFQQPTVQRPATTQGFGPLRQSSPPEARLAIGGSEASEAKPATYAPPTFGAQPFPARPALPTQTPQPVPSTSEGSSAAWQAPQQPREATEQPAVYPTPPLIEAEEKGLNKKKMLTFGGAGIVVLLGAYVFFGARYGLYAFGINLFPFEDLAKKVGLAPSTPSPSPAPPPTKTPTKSPVPTPTAITTPSTPTGPQVNGRMVSWFGSDAEAGTIASLSYSADGKKIAYTLLAGGKNLWVMDLASGSKENLLAPAQAELLKDVTPVFLAWNPDVSQIAVVASDVKTGVASLYLLAYPSKTVTTLFSAQTPAESVAFDALLGPQWLKDSSALIMVIGKSMWRLPKDGSEKTRITPDLAFGSFDASDDGSAIAYTIRRQDEEQVWIMDGDGRNFKQLTPSGINTLPRLSADGLTIFYAQHDKETKSDALMGIKRDGTSLKQLARTTGLMREIRSSLGGKHLAFLARSEGSGNSTLWTIGSDGNGLETVLPPGGEFEPLAFVAWSQSGNALYAAGKKHFIVSVEIGPEPQSPATATPTP